MLRDQVTYTRIDVHTSRALVSEDDDIAAAHRRARRIGQRFNAKLVIWGEKIDETRFYPRLTVVSLPEALGRLSERTYDVQDISALNLPKELINDPLYLIRFAAGFSYVQQNDYTKALRSLEAALEIDAPPAEIIDLEAYTGGIALAAANREINTTNNLARAIDLLEKAKRTYAGVNRMKWAIVQSNLGVAYALLQAGDRAENLQKAIAACRAALSVFTEEESPVQWARAQTNLGNAYGDLRRGNRDENLQNAIASFEAALRVRTREKYPFAWALIQNNLGIAYRQSSERAAQDRNARLLKAIGYYKQALAVRTEQHYPLEWAETQGDLGNAYAYLTPRQTREALACYDAAVRVITRDKLPFRWAVIQCNLAKLYVEPTNEVATLDFIEKGIRAAQAALTVFTENGTPYQWANANGILATGYGRRALLFRGDETAKRQDFQKAIDYNNAALRVFTKDQYPTEWAGKNVALAACYAAMIGENLVNATEAKACLEAALQVYTEAEFPQDHETTLKLLRYVESQASE